MVDVELPNMRGLEIIKVIKVSVLEGKGVIPDDPCRIVEYYYNASDGSLLFRKDPVLQSSV